MTHRGPFQPLLFCDSVTFKGHLGQPSCSEQGYRQPDQVAQSPIQPSLECSRDGASITSLGNPFQCFTTLTVKNFFLIPNLNLPSLSLKPLLHGLSQQALLKRMSLSFLQPHFRYQKAALRSPHSLLFSRLNNPNSLSLSS